LNKGEKTMEVNKIKTGRWGNVGRFFYSLFKVTGIAIGGIVILVNLTRLGIEDMVRNPSIVNSILWQVVFLIFATFLIVLEMEQFGIKFNRQEKKQ
jgi:fucose permease